MSPSSGICLSVALHAEAKPLIDHYALECRSRRGLFPVYSTSGMALVVTGVGKLAAAGAVAYLNTLLGESQDFSWLNVGVAGHRRRCCGEGLVARRITDATSGRSWILNPEMVPEMACERLITVDVPETEYAESAMYDMEAAGFYASARLCTQKEKIQCFKVISDNRRSMPSRLTPARVSRLIGDHLDDVECLIRELKRCPS